jgi:hypothetical protein
VSNKVYTIKFAESHLNLVLGLLGKQAYEQVAPIVNSIGNQIQMQQKAEAESAKTTLPPPPPLQNPPNTLANGHDHP